MLSADKHAAEAEEFLTEIPEARENGMHQTAIGLALEAIAHTQLALLALLASRLTTPDNELAVECGLCDDQMICGWCPWHGQPEITSAEIERHVKRIRELEAEREAEREHFDGPDRMELVRELREAVGLPTAASSMSPRQAWLEALARARQAKPTPDNELVRSALDRLIGAVMPVNTTLPDEARAALLDTRHLTAVPSTGIPNYAMLDVWMALGGDPLAFDRMWQEDRRTPADTWSQLLAVIRGDLDDLMADTNPPPGPEFEALIERRTSTGEDQIGMVPVDECLTGGCDIKGPDGSCSRCGYRPVLDEGSKTDGE